MLNQTLYKNPSQQTKVESTSFPTQQVDDQPSCSQANKSNPFRQADTHPNPLQNVTAIHNPFKNAKQSLSQPPAMT